MVVSRSPDDETQSATVPNVAQISRWRSLLFFVLLAAFLSQPSIGYAHKMRPSHLELTPLDDGRVEVIFKVAYAKGSPMPLEARLPKHCEPVSEPVAADMPAARRLQWEVDCGEIGLAGATIGVDGLPRTGTDVVVTTPDATLVLRPESPRKTLPADGASASEYFPIGVEHIIFGPDHLLFVLGLVLLVGWRGRKLIETITSFTLGHSITLALATLGVASAPRRAVEAIIALSILVLAWELATEEESDDADTSWAKRAPWIFALVCGFLHGFGFAGALTEIGLPSDQVAPALLLFNLGVEAGQLGFVAAVFGIGWIAELGAPNLGERLRPLVVYALGGISSFWVISRTISIFVG